MLSACFVPIELNWPPMKNPPEPSDTPAYTLPPTVGHGDATVLDAVSTATKLPVSGPTKEKLPPRYAVEPDTATEVTTPPPLPPLTTHVDSTVGEKLDAAAPRT